MLITSQNNTFLLNAMETFDPLITPVRRNVARKSTSNRPLRNLQHIKDPLSDDLRNNFIQKQKGANTTPVKEATKYPVYKPDFNFYFKEGFDDSFKKTYFDDNRKKYSYLKDTALLNDHDNISNSFVHEESDEEDLNITGVFNISESMVRFLNESLMSPPMNYDSSDESVDLNRVINYPVKFEKYNKPEKIPEPVYTPELRQPLPANLKNIKRELFDDTVSDSNSDINVNNNDADDLNTSSDDLRIQTKKCLFDPNLESVTCKVKVREEVLVCENVPLKMTILEANFDVAQLENNVEESNYSEELESSYDDSVPKLICAMSLGNEDHNLVEDSLEITRSTPPKRAYGKKVKNTVNEETELFKEKEEVQKRVTRSQLQANNNNKRVTRNSPRLKPNLVSKDSFTSEDSLNDENVSKNEDKSHLSNDFKDTCKVLTDRAKSDCTKEHNVELDINPSQSEFKEDKSDQKKKSTSDKKGKREINEGVLLHVEAKKETSLMRDGRIVKDKEEFLKDIESKIDKNLPLVVEKEFDIQQSLAEEILHEQALRLAHQRTSPRLSKSLKEAVMKATAAQKQSVKQKQAKPATVKKDSKPKPKPATKKSNRNRATVSESESSDTTLNTSESASEVSCKVDVPGKKVHKDLSNNSESKNELKDDQEIPEEKKTIEPLKITICRKPNKKKSSFRFSTKKKKKKDITPKLSNLNNVNMEDLSKSFEAILQDDTWSNIEQDNFDSININTNTTSEVKIPYVKLTNVAVEKDSILNENENTGNSSAENAEKHKVETTISDSQICKNANDMESTTSKSSDGSEKGDSEVKAAASDFKTDKENCKDRIDLINPDSTKDVSIPFLSQNENSLINNSTNLSESSSTLTSLESDKPKLSSNNLNENSTSLSDLPTVSSSPKKPNFESSNETDSPSQSKLCSTINSSSEGLPKIDSPVKSNRWDLSEVTSSEVTNSNFDDSNSRLSSTPVPNLEESNMLVSSSNESESSSALQVSNSEQNQVSLLPLLGSTTAVSQFLPPATQECNKLTVSDLLSSTTLPKKLFSPELTPAINQLLSAFSKAHSNQSDLLNESHPSPNDTSHKPLFSTNIVAKQNNQNSPQRNSSTFQQVKQPVHSVHEEITEKPKTNSLPNNDTPKVLPLSIASRDPRLRKSHVRVILEVSTSSVSNSTDIPEIRQETRIISQVTENISKESYSKREADSDTKREADSDTKRDADSDTEIVENHTETKRKSRRKEVDAELLYKTPLSDLHDVPERSSYKRTMPKRSYQNDQQRDPRSTRRNNTLEHPTERERVPDMYHEYREINMVYSKMAHHTLGKQDLQTLDELPRIEGVPDFRIHESYKTGSQVHSDYYNPQRISEYSSDIRRRENYTLDSSHEVRHMKEYSERRLVNQSQPDHHRIGYQHKESIQEYRRSEAYPPEYATSDSHSYKRPGSFSSEHKHHEFDFREKDVGREKVDHNHTPHGEPSYSRWDYAHKKVKGHFPPESVDQSARKEEEKSKSDEISMWEEERDLIDGPVKNHYSQPYYRRKKYTGKSWKPSHLRCDESSSSPREELFERRRDGENRRYYDEEDRGNYERLWVRKTDQDLILGPERDRWDRRYSRKPYRDSREERSHQERSRSPRRDHDRYEKKRPRSPPRNYARSRGGREGSRSPPLESPMSPEPEFVPYTEPKYLPIPQ